jgi:hypothetical protein
MVMVLHVVVRAAGVPVRAASSSAEILAATDTDARRRSRVPEGQLDGPSGRGYEA